MNSSVHTQAMAQICALFDVPVIQNNLRGLYIEFVVAALLGERWKVASEDWGPWDIEHEDGTLVEIKQSAAKQTWEPSKRGYTAPNFSIRTPKWLWKGAVATAANGRPAHLYIFAWHGDGTETADQRELSQWQFFVVPSRDLPDQKTIGLSSLRKIAEPVSADKLYLTVEAHRTRRKLQ